MLVYQSLGGCHSSLLWGWGPANIELKEDTDFYCTEAVRLGSRRFNFHVACFVVDYKEEEEKVV